MKNLFKNFRIMAVLAILCGIMSCGGPEPDPTPDDPTQNQTETYLRASFLTSDQGSVSIKLETSGLDSLAYTCYQSQQDALQASILFLRGERIKAESSSTLKIDDLKADTRYYFYFAGKTGSKFFGEIVEVEAATTPYQFTDLLTLIETQKRGFTVHINVPENVEKDETKSIRYAHASLGAYVRNKMASYHDTDLLYQNGQVDTRVDKTIVVNMDTGGYFADENGELVIDPETNDYIVLHNPIVPGEPTIFMAAEYEWGEGYIANWGPAGDGFGYFIPLYDFNAYEAGIAGTKAGSNIVTDIAPGGDEDPYWTGAFQKLLFTTDQPDLLDAEIDVIVEDISAIDAIVTIVPDENVYAYTFTVLDDAMYETVLQFVCGREDWMQWLVSSYVAQYEIAMGNAFNEAVQFSVGQMFYLSGYLTQETDFNILITAIGDEDGTTQKFIHKKFSTTAKKLDAPVVHVTAVESGEHEYESKFNIKAPNKDLYLAYYGANYVRDWVVNLNAEGVTYASLCQNAFTADEIEQINSDEGLTISFPSLDGETTRLAVLGMNEEYTSNVLVEGCPAIADCRTKLLALGVHYDSPLFKDLVGDWTMTAKAFIREYDDNQNLVEYTTNIKAKVSISSEIAVPELTEDVYDLYAKYGWSREQTDGYYQDFKTTAEQFNKYRLHYRNRLLCEGWYDYDIYQFSRLQTMTAYDLFVHETYQSYDLNQIMYDFGPKWYLEIGQDGTVTVPFDQMAMPPMLNWGDTPFFVTAYDRVSNHGYRAPAENMPGAFPVQVSADKNTVVIKGVNAAIAEDSSEMAMHYMNAVGGWGSYDAQIYSPIVSDITLKRGWTETPAKQSAAVRSNYVEKPEISTEDCTPVVWKSMTKFDKVQQYRRVEPEAFTMDKLQNSLDTDSPRYQNR